LCYLVDANQGNMRRGSGKHTGRPDEIISFLMGLLLRFGELVAQFLDRFLEIRYSFV